MSFHGADISQHVIFTGMPLYRMVPMEKKQCANKRCMTGGGACCVRWGATQLNSLSAGTCRHGGGQDRLTLTHTKDKSDIHQ